MQDGEFDDNGTVSNNYIPKSIRKLAIIQSVLYGASFPQSVGWAD